jgi:short-subunit dehydrogenase involved in D-alanine esterification of teichoic acids
VLDELKANYPKLDTIQSDIADPAQIAALAKRVKAGYPKLDVLMNNAGIMLHKNLKVPAADLDGLMAEVDINLGGVIRMSSAFIDILTPTKAPSSTYPLHLPSCLCLLRQSTVRLSRRFTPTPNRCGSSWRKLALK